LRITRDWSENSAAEIVDMHGNARSTKDNGPASEKNLAFTLPKNIAQSLKPLTADHVCRLAMMIRA
jgi:hypothetical protein